MGSFFSSWALWEKMTFVLACAIVVTIGLGCFKLWYNHWRLRKYTDEAAKRVSQAPEMADAQDIEKRRNEIPFGIRALERGIEVDGVWISRSNLNTPVSGSPASSAASSIWDNTPPAKQPRSSPRESSCPEPSRSDPRSSFDRAVDAEPLSSRDMSYNTITPKLAPSRAGEMLRRNSSNPYLLRNSTTLDALEGYMRLNSDEISPTKSSHDTPSNSISRSNALVATDAMPQLQRKDHRTNLDLLQSHRLSHVAETGQLTPRIRRQPQSTDWAHLAPPSKPPVALNYYVPRRSPPTPDDSLNPFNTPVSLIPTSQPSSDGHTANTAQQAQPLLDAGQDVADVRIKSLPPMGITQQRRQSQVIRKVNSGFEILRPGTFDVTPTYEALDIDKAQKRDSKRLKKKRPPSQRSPRASSFTEQL